MANFRRGAQAIQEAAARKSGGFTHNITWKKSGDKKFIQFLSPIDDIPTVKFHGYIVTGYTDDDRPIYRSFISRRDVGLDGPEGYDPLQDRFGEIPRERCIAIAVELEPVTEPTGKGGTRQIKSFRVKTREYEDKDGTTHEVPVVGAIIQSPQTFFGWLSSYADECGPIESAVFSIIRKGQSTDTRYDFMEVGKAIEVDIPEEATIDLDGYLDELGDEERMRELIGSLPDDFVVNPYNRKGRGEAKSTNRRARPRPVAQEDEPDAEGDEPVAPRPRASRFAQFKREQEAETAEA